MRWSRSVWRPDLLVAVLVTAVAQLELFAVTAGSGVRMDWALANLVILPALTLRRARPLLSAVVAAVGFAIPMGVGEALGVATPFLVLLFLLGSPGWYASLTAGLVGTSAVLAAGFVPQLLTQTMSAADALVNTVIIAGAWAAGHLLRRLSDRRVAAEISADRVAREAVLAERSRISRDLHDSMGHALTLIALQAGGARERTTEGMAREVFAGIETTARSAMTDLHRLLRLSGREGDEALGVSSIEDPVDDVRRSDLDVDVRVDLPGPVASTVFHDRVPGRPGGADQHRAPQRRSSCPGRRQPGRRWRHRRADHRRRLSATAPGRGCRSRSEGAARPGRTPQRNAPVRQGTRRVDARGTDPRGAIVTRSASSSPRTSRSCGRGCAWSSSSTRTW